MYNDLTFFTNEEGRSLLDRFNKILNSNTQFFDILVGYFRTSGFYLLFPAMENVKKIRILVGLNSDLRTVELVNEANGQISMENLSYKETKDIFSKSIESEFSKSEDSYNVEVGVKKFIQWMKEGKLEIRIFPEAPIHAKVYIMRKDMEKLPDQFGSVITGSSNFSMAGLKNNLEFNVELKDSRDVEFALQKFQELWDRSIDISEVYIKAVNEKTWIKDDITPYGLYLKTIYEYFKEEINQDKSELNEEIFPEGYLKLQYQIDAVIQAKKTLEAYNGVFISDVVGLGKTYISAMLAKTLKKGKKLVVCPPVLVDYWKKVLLEFDVAATVESLGKLDKLIENGVNDYKYIFIDEAHRFRNGDTESFKLLHQICFNKKVILISATPLNNYFSDIENQIYLFQSKHNSTIIPNTKDIAAFFGRLNKKLKKTEKGTKEYYETLRDNSEIIRDQVLRKIMIRRTRNEIMQYYAKDLENQGLSFPKLGLPEKIIYAFDKKIDEVFYETIVIIKKLDYARYTPLLYLKDNKKFATLLISQRNISGFMKSVLIKRLESSFYAFKKTLTRFIDSYERFISMCRQGDIYISKKVNVYDLLDNGDDEKLMNLVDEDKVEKFTIDQFNSSFIPSLERDLSLLKRLKEHWDEIHNDPKLEEFKKELISNYILKDNKIIVFTESKETAYYLGENIDKLIPNKSVIFTGESSEYLKREIEKNFNPAVKDKEDRYRILVTTDVLAEGINLHRSNIVVNYDLPWNPTKIMQRVGRVNRVGSEHKQIFVFNFFPTAQEDANLSLKDNILNKLQAFYDALGEDSKYLTEDEQVTSHKLYSTLTESLDVEDEGGNESSELYYLNLIRQIRDNQPEIFEKMKNLPLKAKTSRRLRNIEGNKTLTFLRRGYLKTFFITDGSNTLEIPLMKAIKYLECREDEKKLSICAKYYEHLDLNKKAFEDKITVEKEVASMKGSIKGNDAKIIKLLKAISKCKCFTNEQDVMIVKLRNLWENGEIPNAITKGILKDVEKISDPVQIFFEICDWVPDEYFEQRKTKINIGTGIKQVILSEYLRGKEA